MRVAYITLVDPTGTSGQNVYSRRVAMALGHRDDVELVLVCPRPSGSGADLTAVAADVRYLPAKRPRSIRWHLGIQRPLATELREAHRERPLDLLVSTLRPSLVVPPLFCRYHDVPYRLLVEGALGPEVRSLTDLPLAGGATALVTSLNVREAEIVFAVNDAVAEWVASVPGSTGVPTVLPHGVDIFGEDEVEPQDRAARLETPIQEDDTTVGHRGESHLPATDLSIGFVGSFKTYHCLQPLVQATAQLRDEGHDIGLVLVGTGPVHGSVTTLAASLGIDDVTSMPGFVDPGAIGQYLDTVDIGYGVIHPDRAGSPMKVYEYLGRGCPVIALDDEEFAFVEQVGAGVLVSDTSVDSVADALRTMLTVGPDERSAMGTAGQEYVSEHGHTWGDVAARLVQPR